MSNLIWKNNQQFREASDDDDEKMLCDDIKVNFLSFFILMLHNFLINFKKIRAKWN